MGLLKSSILRNVARIKMDVDQFEIPLESATLIEEDDARLFTAYSTLLVLNNPEYDYSDIALLSDVVPVVNVSGFQIGSASVSIHERNKVKEIQASLTIDYHSSERLNIEVGYKHLYACSHLNFDYFDGRLKKKHNKPKKPIPVISVEVFDIIVQETPMYSTQDPVSAHPPI